MKSGILIFAVVIVTIGLVFQHAVRAESTEKRSGPWNDPADPGVWPNQTSRANGDGWLMQNHDAIRQMRPRLLVVNFSNEHARNHLDGLINAIIRALAESSRYHGYAEPQAPCLSPV